MEINETRHNLLIEIWNDWILYRKMLKRYLKLLTTCQNALKMGSVCAPLRWLKLEINCDNAEEDHKFTIKVNLDNRFCLKCELVSEKRHYYLNSSPTDHKPVFPTLFLLEMFQTVILTSSSFIKFIKCF